MTRTKSTFLALLVVLLSPMAANATVIYDFVCDDPTCGVPGWGGFFEITDAAVLAGSLTGTADIVAFTFVSPDGGGLLFNLSSLLDDIAMIFSVDGLTITSITDNGVNTACSASGPEACFTDVPATGMALFVDATFVNDVGFNNQTGSWIASTVPEPGTLALLGIGLAGMGLMRRRRKG